jgi:chemotaxis protein methyltransferase CheR
MHLISATSFDPLAITDHDFRLFQALVYDIAGICLQPSRKSLLCGRLSSRLRARGLRSYGEYHELLVSNNEAEEVQHCIDRLTTNETSFFREPYHFEVLERQVLPALTGGDDVRIWSAACSTGQEPYTLAMVAADGLRAPGWEIIASDISTRVLDHAAAARCPLEQAAHIPAARLRAHCLRGIGAAEGSFTFKEALRERIRFMQLNLSKALPDVGRFDVIFLRNVLIYFDREMQRAVMGRLLERLKPGGWLFVGHSESLSSIADNVVAVAPTIYQFAKARAS